MTDINPVAISEDKYNIGLNLRPDICYFGNVQDRGISKNFGILQDDRRRHMYILGKSGMGKSTLLENMIIEDIYNGHGVCFIDPHGDSATYILDRIPAFRQNDVVYFNPADTEHPIGLNMLESVRGEEPFLVASSMMAVFQRIWAGMWSSRMEYILNNTLLALLETPGNTLLGVVRMLTDNDFQKKIINNIEDPMVKNFWTKEYASFNDKYKTEAIAPVLNKIGQFFSTDLVRNILGQTKSTIDLRDIMDNKKIFIVNLSKGRLGDDNSSLLGSLLITKLQLAAMSRVDMPESARNDFYVYVDEFQNFTTDTFATILSEARKYRLCLILAHQYINQLTESGNEKVRNAVFGNVGTMVSFRVGTDDVDTLEKEFEPVFKSQQLINLNARQIALKMSIGGKPSLPFIASTLPPIFATLNGRIDAVIAESRERNTKPKAVVKGKINDWLNKDYGEEFRQSKPQGQGASQGQNPNYTPRPNQGGQSNYQRNDGGGNYQKNDQGGQRKPYQSNSYDNRDRQPRQDGQSNYQPRNHQPYQNQTNPSQNEDQGFQSNPNRNTQPKRKPNTYLTQTKDDIRQHKTTTSPAVAIVANDKLGSLKNQNKLAALRQKIVKS
jgi:Type IV secretion-system coupling protein DNA-binding domain